MGVKKTSHVLILLGIISITLLIVAYICNIVSFATDDMTWIKIITDTPDTQNYAYCGNHLHGTTTFETPSDYYLFGVPSINDGNSVIFNSCNSTFNTAVSLYDSDWELIQTCDKCNNCVVSPIHSGTHYLVLSGIYRAYGDYQLQITCSQQHLTPSPTTAPVQLPVKALSECGWKSFDDKLGLQHLFLCNEEHCGYEPESGDYNQYCKDWGIFCNMEHVGKVWFIFGIGTLVLGLIVLALWVVMLRKCCGESKCIKIVTLFMTIAYSVACFVDIIIYYNTQNCGDDYCKHFFKYVPGLYKCDFYCDGFALICMWMAGSLSMVVCCFYFGGLIIAKIIEQRKNRMNGLLQE